VDDAARKDVLTLTLTRVPWHLDVDCPPGLELDLAIAMLEQARRWLDVQVKMSVVARAQQRRKLTESIADMVVANDKRSIS
jgi:hypothetical protein